MPGDKETCNCEIRRILNNSSFAKPTEIVKGGNAGGHYRNARVLPFFPFPRVAPGDWTVRYGKSPRLCETFVEIPGHGGGVCRASGWIPAGATRGRGRHDLQNRAAESPQ